MKTVIEIFKMIEELPCLSSNRIADLCLEMQKIGYNQGLKDAAASARISWYGGMDNTWELSASVSADAIYMGTDVSIDKKSILELKKTLHLSK